MTQISALIINILVVRIITLISIRLELGYLLRALLNRLETVVRMPVYWRF